MYIALPLAERFYRFLTRNQKPAEVTASATAENAAPVEAARAATHDRPSLLVSIPLVLAAMLVSNVVFHRSFDPKVLLGFVIMTAVLMAALALKKWAKISPIIGLSTIGLLLGSPWSPVATWLTETLAPIEFLPMTTAVLVLAGLGLGKDSAVLRRIGWRIIPVGLVSFAASFLAAALIAEAALGLG